MTSLPCLRQSALHQMVQYADTKISIYTHRLAPEFRPSMIALLSPLCSQSIQSQTLTMDDLVMLLIVSVLSSHHSLNL
jgi:hypothetical protein